MKISLSNITTLKSHLKDPLYKNSIFLILSSATASGSGFFFWLIAAKFYPAEEIGLASAIISVIGLISLLSLLGFDISLSRYIPEKSNEDELINSCITISSIFSLLLAIIFVTGIDILSPSLAVIKENKIFLSFFFVFTVVLPLVILQREGIFVGYRKTEYTFLQSVIVLLRIVIVPFLTAFGALGIFASYGLMSFVAFIVGIFLVTRVSSFYKFLPRIKKEIMKDIFHFSLGNYIARIFEELPTYVLPIMVINVLGAKVNAYFFIAWSISILICRVPRWVSMSLLAEGAYNVEELWRNTKRGLKFILSIIIPAIIVILFFGENLLGIFGEGYRTANELLLISVLGSIPFTFIALFTAIKRVQKEVTPVVYTYGFIAVITLVASYILIQNQGIVGIGIAWVIGNTTVAFGIGVKKLFQGHFRG